MRPFARGLLLGLALLSAGAFGAAPALAHTAPDPVTTHRDTPAELSGVDLAQAVQTAQLTSLEGLSPGVATSLPTAWCGTATTTDNTANATFAASLPQVKVIYAYASDQTNRIAQWQDNLQADASLINQFVSSQLGSSKAPRLDLGTSCGPQYLDIQTVALPNTSSYYLNNFTNIRNAVQTQVNASPGGPRNYLIIADKMTTGGIYGLGQVYAGPGYDNAASTNIHNSGDLYATIFVPSSATVTTSVNGWQPTLLLHEMTHNFGAVQWSAPHTSQPAGGTDYTYTHCWDGYDVMCYSDGPSPGHAYSTSVCSAGSGAMWQTYDCNQDDYFNPSPAAGSYLATHWDVYNNGFMADCSTLPAGSCLTATTIGPPVSTLAPVISGTAEVGQTLTAGAGTWTNSPTGYAYQWQRSTDSGSTWTAISGAASSSYTLTAADLAATIRVHLTASNTSGTGTVDGNPVGPVADRLPVNTGLPTLIGTATRGQTLTASTGTWTNSPTGYAYQWQRSTDGGSTWTTITGAAASAYDLAAADVGATVRVKVTATNAYGPVSASSAATATVIAAPPVNTAAPAVTGIATRGQTLTAGTGAWTSTPTAAYAYQWQRSSDSGATWTTISGATSSAYTLTIADVGTTLRVNVTATNPDGTAAASSVTTATVITAPPVNTAAPTVTGTAKAGQALTAAAGAWTSTPAATYAYQWQRSTDTGASWTDVSGATTLSYTLVAGDAGAVMRVKVTATNPDGYAAANSTPTAAVATALPPVNTAAPTVTGTPKRTSTLTVATDGTWNPAATSYAYRWQRSTDNGSTWTNLAATATSYTLLAADIGAIVRAQVTATNSDGAAIAVSVATATVAGAPPVNTASPTFSPATGLKRTTTLTATPGTWSPTATGYAYRWQRSTDAGSTWNDIAAATSPSYTLAAADIDANVRVQVTATNTDGSDTAVSASSAATVAAAPPVKTVTPVITGNAKLAARLTATAGSWTPTGATYAYQWQRSTDNGLTFTDIAGQTANAYTLAAADVGALVRVLVTATNADGSAAAGSAPTAAVSPAQPPVNTAAPTVTGTPKRTNTLTATAGSWSPAATSYSYRWQRSIDAGTTWTDIANATYATYVLAAADVGADIRVQVTASNADGPAVAVSAATATVDPAPPVNTVIPKFTPAIGLKRAMTLTATAGSWSPAATSYAYRWQRSADDGFTWTDIAAATAQTYTLAAADIGANVRVQVTASNLDGPTTAVSADSVTPVAAAPPVNTVAPAVTGAAKLGVRLSATAGTWTPTGATYAYQWQRSDDNGQSWTDIAGQSTNAYTLVAADGGALVRVQVSATNADGSATAASASATTVTSPPMLQGPIDVPTGTLIDTGTLTADPGTWTGASTFTYQWLRCPAGATTSLSGCIVVYFGAIFHPTGDDVGRPIALRVTASSPAGTTVATSPLTAPVQGRALSSTQAPDITGAVQVIETVRATAGSWSVPTRTVRYQWLRCEADGSSCVNIAAAIANTYTLTRADAGHTLAVRVTATSPGQTTAATSNTVTVADQPAPQATTLPVISGNATRLQALSATAGTWTNRPTLRFQWQRCAADMSSCADIAGATTPQYVLRAADRDQRLTVTVSATNTSATTTATSNPTAPVGPALPVLRAAPGISGVLVQGALLSVSRVAWAPTSDTRYAYAWQRCELDGSSCVDIAGATRSSYTLTAADIDQSIRVVVTAVNPDGAVPATSPATGKVLPAPPHLVTLPKLKGMALVGHALTAAPGVWTGAVDSTTLRFYRCSTKCVAVGDPDQTTYPVTAADQGYTFRAAELASGPGGKLTAWSPTVLGPVRGAGTGLGLPSIGGRATIRTSGGVALAAASVSRPQAAAASLRAAAKAAGAVKVTVRRASKVSGRLRVWVCPKVAAGRPWKACTKPVTLSRSATIKLALGAGERVQVVVTRAKR